MLSLSTDPKVQNPVLSCLKIETSDRLVSIKENGNCDSNFIITHLIKQILYEKHKLLLVGFHNPTEHYQNVGKKLGYDLLRNVKEGNVKVIEPLKDLADKIVQTDEFVIDNPEDVAKHLFLDIKNKISQFKIEENKCTYLIIDDLSHLLDLNIDLSVVLSFINYCNSLISLNNINVIINTHVCTKIDEIISKSLRYVCDVHIEISPLKTGMSQDVTGTMRIHRQNSINEYQYKAYDRGIKTFKPGESILHLYK